MRRPHLLFGPTLLIGVSATLLVLHACQDSSDIMTETDVTASAVTRTLTVVGSGTGDGTVKSTPAGINCTVTKGTASSSGCKAAFKQGTIVTLTATPKAGSSFRGWFRACTGTGGCKTTMSVARTVEARFVKGPFQITIGAGTGTGSGRVRSQSGLTPVIDCRITSGTPAATGCSARYPANTALVLTATPAAGHTFSWGQPCTGSGTCRFTVTQARTVNALFRPGSSTAATRGRWGATLQFPVVGVHVHLLPTGKVLFWGDRGDAQLWDPAQPTAGFTPLAKTYRIFCSGHTFLPDGRLLIAGGTITGTKGDRRAVIFDPGTNAWSPAGSFAQGRYYPTITVMPNGEVLALSGSDESGVVVPIPEIGDGGSWRRLTGASLAIPNPYYPAVFVAPNGRAFLAGFQGTTRYLDTQGDGAWTTVGNRLVADRTLGSAVMYAPGKVLYAGGGDPPTSSAEVIDLNEPSPAWRSVPGMQFARRQMNATILADGQVLITNGTSGPGFNDVTRAVQEAELWNPATQAWTTMAREAVARTYHSAALLLPDARVLSTGSGEGGGVLYENSEFTGQVFSPPYLFNADGSLAARPTIASAPDVIHYGGSFTVESPQAGSVTRGTLVRLSSVTHAFNQSQLVYPLTLSAEGPTTLRSQAPTSPNLAPPGPYMLFLLNAQGVPSMARMVRVGP
jgi:Domain of unknown function (DUF1929)/Divergent InlB B-repeat domain